MKLAQRALFACFLAVAALLPATAAAQITGTSVTATTAGIPLQFGTFEQVINTGFRLTILVSGIIFVALILYGGVLYLTSVGDEDVVGKARRIIINGAVGLVIVLTSFAVGTYVLQLLCIGQSGSLNTNPNAQNTSTCGR